MEPLRSGGSAITFRIQALMDAKQRIEIGERIKELRNNSPQTNRSIADHVGIGERAVAAWIAGGGISYDNAEKVAELFGVTTQWLLNGKEVGPSPNVMDELSDVPAVLHRLEGKVDEVLAALAPSAAVAVAEQAASAQPRSRSARKRPSKKRSPAAAK